MGRGVLLHAHCCGVFCTACEFACTHARTHARAGREKWSSHAATHLSVHYPCNKSPSGENSCFLVPTHWRLLLLLPVEEKMCLHHAASWSFSSSSRSTQKCCAHQLETNLSQHLPHPRVRQLPDKEIAATSFVPNSLSLFFSLFRVFCIWQKMGEKKKIFVPHNLPQGEKRQGTQGPAGKMKTTIE